MFVGRENEPREKYVYNELLKNKISMCRLSQTLNTMNQKNALIQVAVFTHDN